MPPEMIATARYKKKPAGTIINCSASSAKVLSALGMANYRTTDYPGVINREMNAVAPASPAFPESIAENSVTEIDEPSVVNATISYQEDSQGESVEVETIVVNQISEIDSDAAPQHGNKVIKGNPKPAKPSRK